MTPPCTQLDEFYHICGHQIPKLNHTPTCSLEQDAVAGHLNPLMIFQCPEGRDIRGAFKMGQCPTCESGYARGLPHLPGQLARLRSDFQQRMDEQNAADARQRAIEEVARKEAESLARKRARRRAKWLADREEERLAEERECIELKHQTLVLLPDTTTSLLLKAVAPDGDECAICKEPMVASENVDIRQLPCEHRFHVKCIVQWLEPGTTGCPCCRQCKVIVMPDFDRPARPERGMGDPDTSWLQRGAGRAPMEFFEDWFAGLLRPGHERLF